MGLLRRRRRTPKAWDGPIRAWTVEVEPNTWLTIAAPDSEAAVDVAKKLVPHAAGPWTVKQK